MKININSCRAKFIIKAISKIERLYDFGMTEKEFKWCYGVGKKEIKRETDYLFNEVILMR